MNHLDQLSYYAKHQDEFPEKAPSEFLEWCLKEEDFPEQEKSWAQHELHIRKTGRTIIAVPKENEDGSPMKREDDGATIVDFAYTKGNTRTSNNPEIICFYPSAKSTRFALNKISELIRERSIPVPTGMPQIIEDPFENGTPCFYFLLEGEQREYAQEHYVCQLDKDQDVIHLLIPAPNGDIQMQWVPEQMRPFGVEGQPMKASFWVEMIQKVEKQLEDEDNGKFGKSLPLVEDDQVKELNPDLIPFIDYTPLNGIEKGSDEFGLTNFQVSISALSRTITYLLVRQLIDYKSSKASQPWINVYDVVKKSVEIIKTLDPSMSEALDSIPSKNIGEILDMIQQSNSAVNLLSNDELCFIDEETLKNEYDIIVPIEASDDDEESDEPEELILPESELPIRFNKEGEIEVALNLSFSDGEFDTSKITLENLLRQCSQTDLMGESLEAVGRILANTFDTMGEMAKDSRDAGKPVPEFAISTSILCLTVSGQFDKIIEAEFDKDQINSDHVNSFMRIINLLGKEDELNIFGICKDIVLEIGKQKQAESLYYGKENLDKPFTKKTFNILRSCTSISTACYLIGFSLKNIEEMTT
jgi:hypothetical protein